MKMNTKNTSASNTELISLELEGLPPTVNHMHRNARGRVFRTKECRDYQEYVASKIMQQRAREWPYSGRVALTLEFTASNRRRWDIDNRVKAIQDCLAPGGVIENDTQIDELHVRRIVDTENKRDKTRLILEKL